MHGWKVPRDYAHALQLDAQNGNTKWKDAIDLEIEQIKQYQDFKEHGKVEYEKGKVTNAPMGHQKIRIYFMFDVKHCGNFKPRLVTDGHLTKEPTETVYSGVVSLRKLRLAMFLTEFNNLQLWGADVGNAYLQAVTEEKLYVVAGQNSKSYKDMFLLCSTHSMAQDLEEQQMDFKPSRADLDIWMRSSKEGTHYEYITVYENDLGICMKDPQARKYTSSSSKVLDH